jgi:hypothetical protein
MHRLKTGCLLIILAASTAHSSPVFFHFDGTHYELKAQQATPGEIFAEIGRVLQIPVGDLPGSNDPITIHSRSTSLEKVLSSICDSFVVAYGTDTNEQPVIQSINVTASVDPIQLDRVHRSRVVQKNNLQRITAPPRLRQPIQYAGIGAYISLSPDGNALWLRPINKNTPAARANIQLGDAVIAIDGIPVEQFADQNAIAQAIRGRVGTPVSLLILKPDGSQVNQVLMRQKIATD